MRLDELTRASRHPIPDAELPDDVRSGDWSDIDDVRRQQRLRDHVVPLFNDFQKKWGLSRSVYGTFRNTRPEDLSLKYIDRLYGLSAEDRQIMHDNWPALSRDLAALLKRRWAMGRLPDLQAAKLGARRNINPKDARKLLDIVRLMTKKSYQRLDARAIPLLRKMTVIPARLPRYVYRGIFFDGAKINPASRQGWDENETARLEAWKKKWAPGSFPKGKIGKATSWSTRRDTAIDFMEAQDNVKDSSNGFHVLLRYDISADPSVVVADLRNIPQNDFWNQQEILLSKEAINYEVIEVFPYGDKSFKDFRDANRNWSAGSVGLDYAEVVLVDFFATDRQQDPAYVQKWRTFKDMTVAEVDREITTTNPRLLSKYPKDKLFPLAALARLFFLEGLKNQEPDSKPNEMRATYRMTVSESMHDNFAARVWRIDPDVPQGSSLRVKLDITLERNHANAFQFNVEVTGVELAVGYGKDFKDAPQFIDLARDEIKRIFTSDHKMHSRLKLTFT